MARGATLESLLTSLRVELGLSTNVAHNIQARDAQIALIQRTQETLWDDFTWPHLRVYRYIALEAGTRYYDPAACLKYDNTGALAAAGDMQIDRVSSMWVRDGSIWRPMYVGVTEDDFNAWNSDTAQQSWPPRRWQVAEGNQIEIWPIPGLSSDTDIGENLIRIHGERNLAPLVEATDRADLDDRLITLTIAAEMLAGEKGEKKAVLAKRRMLQVRGNNVKKRRFKMFGHAGRHERLLRGPPTVYYRTTP
jgi:hypothetical protein